MTVKELMMNASRMAMAGLVLLTTSCSAFRDSNQQISITVTPADALTTVNGKRVEPPTTVSVRRDRNVSVIAQKAGYAPFNKVIGTHYNETAALDLVGFILILVPGIGLFFPGAKSLDETEVNAVLYPLQ